MTKKITGIILIFCIAAMTLSAFPAFVVADDSVWGTCGENVTWSYVEGTLTLYGSGDMDDYDNEVDETDGKLYGPWKYYSDEIFYIVISGHITSIGDQAFAGLSHIHSIEIPFSVTRIGVDAFANSSVQSVTYGGSESDWEKITIEDGNNRLTSSSIEFSVTSNQCGDNLTWSFNSETGELSITGSGDMYDWYSASDVPWYGYHIYITSVTIDSSVTALGYNSFYNCTNLTQITLPENLTNIPTYTFRNCTALMEISLPDALTYIGFGAFMGCSALTEVIFPTSLKEIYYGAFESCTSLSEITIPENVTSIASDVFGRCTSLERITLPDSYVDIGLDAFFGTAYYNNADNWDGDFLYMGDYLITAKSSSSGECSVKDGTLYIAGYAFNSRSALTSVTLPDSLKVIGNWAFYKCTGLTSMTVPEGVTRIGEDAFYYCSNLLTVDLPDTLTSIGSGAFTSSGLTEITIPNGVRTIEDTAFSWCRSLTDITVPDTIMNLGYNAFYYSAYYADESNWEDGVLYVGKYLIAADSSVVGSTYAINDGTLLIANYAFEDCEELVDITIPDSVRAIGAHAFLRTGYYNDETNWEDNVLYLGKYLLASTLNYDEETDEIIGGVSGSYNVKDGTVCIASCGLRYSGDLTDIIIPSSVINIGQCAFEGCTSLTDVYYTGNAEEWAEIYIDTYNEPLLNATIHYDYEPADEGVALAVIGKYSQSVEASILRENDSITLTVNILDTAILTSDQVRAFAASYNDSTAAVVELDKTVFASDTIIFTGNIDESCKIFIWNENMQPITEAAE